MTDGRFNEFKHDEYLARRKELFKHIEPNSIVILSTHCVSHRNGDINYPYRQDSNFYYLTGFEEEEAVALFSPGQKNGEFILFNRPHDSIKEIWTGERIGQDGACEKYHADKSYPLTELGKRLPALLEGKSKVYYPAKNTHIEDLKLIFETLKYTLTDIEPIIHKMRQIKDHYEIGYIKKAIAISEEAHLEAIKQCRPGKNERDLEAALVYIFTKNGAKSVAYPNIVASGKNACTLHYDKNQDEIHDGDLVLIDAGVEYRNYSSDITRTFPANGKFSAEQRAIYDLVLKAQIAGIKAVAPGSSWKAVSKVVADELTKGLLELGLLKGHLKKLTQDMAYAKFYMHSPGHWMGLDVHDVGKENILFKPNMVLTMEPGIYISPDKDVDKRWHHIGVRIEDDVLVTENGCEVLSSHLPKKTDDIENYMASFQQKYKAEEKPVKKSSTAKSLESLGRRVTFKDDKEEIPTINRECSPLKYNLRSKKPSLGLPDDNHKKEGAAYRF